MDKCLKVREVLLIVAAVAEILEDPPVAVVRKKMFLWLWGVFVHFFFFFSLKHDQLIDGT